MSKSSQPPPLPRSPLSVQSLIDVLPSPASRFSSIETQDTPTRTLLARAGIQLFFHANSQLIPYTPIYPLISTLILQSSAAAILGADAVLLCSGAGMGVDSGFGTFRGRHAGVWPPLKALGMDYVEACSPALFVSDPRLAWGFWSFSYNTYAGRTLQSSLCCRHDLSCRDRIRRYVRNGTPHAGYRYCAEWGASKRHGRFSVTSNIDGHWGRVMSPSEIWECHGAVTHLQASDCPEGPIWTADPHQMARAAPSTWDLTPGDLVEVQIMKGTRHDCRRAAAERIGPWAQATVADDSVSLIFSKQSASHLSSKHGLQKGLGGIQVCAVRKPGGTDLSRVADLSLLPRAREQTLRGSKKGQEREVLARPNVYMFGDRLSVLVDM
jgi:hypothetical protein